MRPEQLFRDVDLGNAPGAGRSAREMLQLLRERWAACIYVWLLCQIITLLYLSLAPVKYNATAQIIIDSRNALQFTQESPQRMDAASESSYIDSQIEILKSDSTILGVVKALNLVADPNVCPGSKSIWGMLTGGGSNALGLAEQACADAVQRGLAVKRVGLTSVISISFEAANADLSAVVGNEVAKEYFSSQVQSRNEAARRAVDWLGERLVALRSQAEAAELAEQAARAKGDVGPVREASSRAQAARATYDVFLKNYSSATQMQSFPLSEGRIVTPAVRPLKKSSPRWLLSLAVSNLLGLAAGTASAVASGVLDRKIRTARDVTRSTHLKLIGCLPYVSLLATSPDTSISAAPAFTSAMRLLRSEWQQALDRGRRLGVTSAHDDAGKTTVCLNLARVLADAGFNPLLIDCDLIRAPLAAFSRDGQRGLFDVFVGRAAPKDVICTDSQTSAAILATPKGAACENDLFASPKFAGLIQEIGQDYTHVILNLPPAIEVEARAIFQLADQFVFVIEAGKTTIDEVNEALIASSRLNERTIGAILNKVPVAVGLTRQDVPWLKMFSRRSENSTN